MQSPEIMPTQAILDRAHFETELEERGLLRPHSRSESEDESTTYLGWRQAGKHAVSISFEGDGHYGIAMRRAGKMKAGAEDGDVYKRMPSDLEAYLRELADF